mmetsp:Transcript_49973/g.138522  ORF Transcript_49973/g.138522 Transcript_49973/m.138522 type:complete len:253 (-) Transcript_49973:295-1053(-)
MVADAGDASLARQGCTFVVLVTDEVNLSIRASTGATPNASSFILRDLNIPRGRRALPGGFAHNLAEGALGLHPQTITLNAIVAGDAPAHVAFVSYLVYPPVRTSTISAPHANWGSHIPIDYVPGNLEIGVIVRPLEGIELLIGPRLVRSGIDALKHPPQHVVSHAKLVIGHDVAVLLHIGAKPLARANFKVSITRNAREMHSERFRARLHCDSESSVETCGIAAQLKRRAKLPQLECLPIGGALTCMQFAIT